MKKFWTSLTKTTPALLTTKLSLINWQYHLTKWVLICIIAIVWTWHWYEKGATECKTKAAELALSEVVTDVKNRLPVVQQAERDAASLRQEMETIKEKLDEETSREPAGDCGISDQQLQLYRTLSEKTKR